jgi:hypothetical protein
MKTRIVSVIWCVLLVWAGTACSSEAPQPLESIVVAPSASPLDSPIVPVAQPSKVVPFQLDRPLRAGATEISGSGPEGILIVLEDVSFMGAFVGSGTTDESGRFQVTFSEPLESRHRIGLTIDVGGTSWTPDDFSSEAFHGEEALLVPQVGFYYDTAMVRE